MPTKSTWTVAYITDSDTNMIINSLVTGVSLTAESIDLLNVAYRHGIINKLFRILETKLVYYKKTLTSTSCILRIVVPSSLRRDLFSSFHASPVDGHMGEYKILHHLKVRCFWPYMRKGIKAWIKAGAHCNLTNRWRRRGSELLFSWPVSSPFAILHADLWCPGDFTDYTGSRYLLNVMCDLTQFVVIVPVPGATSAVIAKYVMQDFLLKFGLYLLVVIDNGTPFKAAFTTACGSLKIPFECSAKRNHMSLLVEKLHRFLNKVVIIASNDRDTLDYFVEVGISAGYAWNSDPIDGTYIIRSIPAIGRELPFFWILV